MKQQSFLAALFCAGFLTLTACGGGSSGGSGNNGSGSGDGGGGDPVVTPTPDPDTNPDPTPIENFTIGGAITGLEGTITLALNGRQESFTTSTFTFMQEIEEGSPFGVSFVETDNGQICVVGQSGSGIANADIDTVSVLCSPLSNTLRFIDGSPIGNIAVGDFNRDTSLDLVFNFETNNQHSSGGNSDVLRIMWGNGVGAFTQGVDLAVTRHLYAWSGGSVISGSFDGNAVDDIAFYTAGSLDRFLGQNAADPVKVNTPYLYQRLSKMIFKDVTGDDIGDIVTFNEVPGNDGIFEFFAVLPGMGDGNFGEIIPSGSFLQATIDPALQALGFVGAANILVEDFDGDGSPDILARGWNRGEATIGVFSNDGSGVFDYPSAMITLPSDMIIGEIASLAPLHMAAQDIDLDGDMDVVISSTTTFIMTLLNDGNGGFTLQQRVQVGSEPAFIALADLDNDDLPDLVSANQNSKTITISWNMGNGLFGQNGDSEDDFTIIRAENDSVFREMIIANIDGAFPDIIYVDDNSRTDNFAPGAIHIIPNPGLDR